MIRSIMPAAMGLLGFAIALALGILTRSTVAALGAGLVIGIVALFAAMNLRTEVVPATRIVEPIAAAQGTLDLPVAPSDPNTLTLRRGYLDASGDAIGSPWLLTNACADKARAAGFAAAGVTAPFAQGSDAPTGPSGDGSTAVALSPEQEQELNQARQSPEYQSAAGRTMVECAHARGIESAYADYLPGSMLWPMRGAMTGISVMLAALLLWLSAARLRKAVAKR